MGEPATTEIVGAPRAAAPGPIAAPIHLVIVLVVMGFLAYSGAADANAIAHAPSFNRSIFYIVTILFEWLMLGIVVLGVRLHRSPLSTVFGDRWHSIREVARDIGIAAVFWLVAAIILSATFGPSTETVSNDVVRAMLPHGPMESSLWIALSITAGICEEAIFRGYLQRQLIAYSRSSIVGILGSRGLRRRTFLQGRDRSASNSPLRRAVRNPGVLAEQRAAGNDRPCVHRRFRRRARQTVGRQSRLTLVAVQGMA